MSAKIRKIGKWGYNKRREIDKDKLVSLIKASSLLVVLAQLNHTTHRNGVYFSSYCPKCKSKFSATIKTDQSRHWFWCHHCDNKGDVLEYIQSYGYNFLDSCRFLCELTGEDFSNICKDKE